MKRIIKITYILFGMLFMFTCSSCRNESKSLDANNVIREWRYGGASHSSFPSLKIYYKDGENVVEAPIIMGGMEDPTLSYKDIDGDGVDEIILEGSGDRQVIKFHRDNKSFSVIENTVQYP